MYKIIFYILQTNEPKITTKKRVYWSKGEYHEHTNNAKPGQGKKIILFIRGTHQMHTHTKTKAYEHYKQREERRRFSLLTTAIIIINAAIASHKNLDSIKHSSN